MGYFNSRTHRSYFTITWQL